MTDNLKFFKFRPGGGGLLTSIHDHSCPPRGISLMKHVMYVVPAADVLAKVPVVPALR